MVVLFKTEGVLMRRTKYNHSRIDFMGKKALAVLPVGVILAVIAAALMVVTTVGSSIYPAGNITRLIDAGNQCRSKTTIFTVS